MQRNAPLPLRLWVCVHPCGHEELHLPTLWRRNPRLKTWRSPSPTTSNISLPTPRPRSIRTRKIFTARTRRPTCGRSQFKTDGDASPSGSWGCHNDRHWVHEVRTHTLSRSHFNQWTVSCTQGPRHVPFRRWKARSVGCWRRTEDQQANIRPTPAITVRLLPHSYCVRVKRGSQSLHCCNPARDAGAIWKLIRSST